MGTNMYEYSANIHSYSKSQYQGKYRDWESHQTQSWYYPRSIQRNDYWATTGCSLTFFTLL